MSADTAAPDVSIVLPFRDAVDTVADAIASLQAQTLTCFECVLVDHQSADGSVRIAERICGADSRFRIVRSEGSFVDALRAGCAAARSDLIARMDADDLAAPRRLEIQCALLQENSSITVASCLVAAFPTAAIRDGMRRYVDWSNSIRSPEQIRNALFVESPLIHPSVIVRRAALDAVGGYATSDGPEDYDLWLRLLLAGYRAAKVPEVLLQWRDTPTRLTRTDGHYAEERIFDMKLQYLPSVLPVGKAIQICGAGPIGRHWARALRKIGYTIRRFVDVDVTKQGRTIGGCRVDPPDDLDGADGFVLAAVGVPGAREQIEVFLQERGLQPWSDYLTVA